MEIKEGDVIINIDNKYANSNKKMELTIRGFACMIMALCCAKSDIQLAYFKRGLAKLNEELILIHEEEKENRG